MTHTYTISGMTCNHCVARVKKELMNVRGVQDADVTLNPPMATLIFDKAVELSALQAALVEAGPYQIHDAGLKNQSAERTGDLQV